ncbi:regulatory protein RecX [Acinetobacter sp. ANC 4648]|uniref:regulatory protein RecX n=1 Tax=Acinetobacter sp. ANC 4648 TaxID=1977875 RepID=UPI000A33A26A|nr:regulatory protein RecX [Acinetobacter sp. ANC 4648]OTG82212.1 RecX family transcriptional regulator [Acinetobacter sp. ANC 4648]
MENSKFPKLLNYTTLKQQFNESYSELSPPTPQEERLTSLHNENRLSFDDQLQQKQSPGLTGTRLRSYAFAVLTRKEYSKVDLIEKLARYAQNKDEVVELVEELAKENYQSDQRVAEMLLRSQIRKGKGPNSVKMALRAKNLDKTLVHEDIQEIDWYEQAYQLKVKKYGVEVAKDPKIKAKQIRFLQHRGFEMDAIMKAIVQRDDD